MGRSQIFVDKRVLLPSQTLLALGMVSEIELLRLKTIARAYVRGQGWLRLLRQISLQDKWVCLGG
jgi:hypothetical protein